MRITEAKEIPLEIVVIAFGGTYSHTKGKDMWFKSPLRPNERTASFKIDLSRNRWHDFGHAGGQGAGGDILDLWCELHNLDRKTGIKQALEGLNIFHANPIQGNKAQILLPRRPITQEAEQPRFEIIKLSDRIFYPSLIAEINRRKIPMALADRYLKQAFIRDNKFPNRKLNGIAFANDKGGYEISIPNPKRGKSFKTSLIAKAPTTIEGADNTQAAIFEGFWDFLSWLAMTGQQQPDCLVYVLHSVSFVPMGLQQVIKERTIQTVLCFFDNDMAGDKVTDITDKTLKQFGIAFHEQNQIYQGFKDINEYWLSK